MASPAPTRQQLLLVDDEVEAIDELAELLEGEGFICFIATSVNVALHQLALHPDIALIITDLRMPDESGLSLIKRLREHTSRQHLPVIVTSGHADMEDVSDLLRLQVLDLFRKPIYHVRLLETLNALFPEPASSGEEFTREDTATFGR
ncbi:MULTISPECIES: response regulator [unclassified Pseudomonas]|uniref:response regulator n=1 Tax=unclassified Pseudomonas TaxID=196821 RepID=UPI002AC9701A|nr:MULTISPECIES: response regulator [unclassified Pseudomonas]MEB0041638.1 response regulator [Pseudomonas sp. MH10]MEB0121986.1 response regulator [Pseudomonas sp. CCI1.2]WPX61951.1 response regulator [Pseudomonas sp. MH10]